MEPKPIVIEGVFNAALARVWHAWTTPSELTQWLSEEANIRIESGGLYELFWEPDHPERNSTRGCTLTDIQEYEKLSFTWKGPDMYAAIMNTEPLPTYVDVLFRSLGSEQTLVQLVHSGWKSGPQWSEARAWQQKAWQVAFQQLREYLEEQ